MKKKWKAARYAASVCVVLVAGAFLISCPMEGDETPLPENNVPIEKGGGTFTVTFHSNGGSSVKAQIIAKGSKATEPNTPIKSGFTFMGWYKEASCITPYKFNDPVNANITLYARWLADSTPTFTVTFETNGGSPFPKPQNREAGDTVTPPSEPKKTGYDFDGWYTGDKKWEFDKDTVNGHITLTAHWKAQKRTITFDSNGGSDVAPVEADFGATISAPENPVKTGYDFDGWYRGTIKWEFDKDTVGGNTTLKARWKLAASFLGVWQTGYLGGYEALLLLEDEKVWLFQYSSGTNPLFSAFSGNWSELSSVAVFNDDTTLTLTGNGSPLEYEKHTGTKTPAGHSSIEGFWAHIYDTLELNNSGTAILEDGGTPLTLTYCVEGSMLYLLTNDNRVIIGIPIIDNGLPGLIRTESDARFAGIWTRTDRPYYYELNKGAMGIFHVYGKMLAMADVIDGGKINGMFGYTFQDSNSTLTVKRDEGGNITYNKRTQAPSSGGNAGGDTLLHGSWNADDVTANLTGGITNITFKNDGTGIMGIKNRGEYPMIWKSSRSGSQDNLEMYCLPSLGDDALVYFPNYKITLSGGSQVMKVFVSGSNYLTFTKQSVSQNFSDFGKGPLYSEGKSGILGTFPHVFPGSSRVLGKIWP